MPTALANQVKARLARVNATPPGDETRRHEPPTIKNRANKLKSFITACYYTRRAVVARECNQNV